MYTNLSIFVILGFPLLITYYNLLGLSKNDIHLLWTNNNTNIMKKSDNFFLFAQMSVLIAFLCGFYMMYYLTYNVSSKKIFSYDYNTYGHYFIEISLLLFIGYSLLWLPAFYTNIISLRFVLFMVSLGSLLLFLAMCSINVTTNLDILAIVASGFLFFQHFFMDFLVWSSIIA